MKLAHVSVALLLGLGMLVFNTRYFVLFPSASFGLGIAFGIVALSWLYEPYLRQAAKPKVLVLYSRVFIILGLIFTVELFWLLKESHTYVTLIGVLFSWAAGILSASELDKQYSPEGAPGNAVPI